MTKIPKIFISYSRVDKRGVDELRLHLAPLQRTGKVKLFYDAEIIPGEKWDKRIRQELESADIILFFLSPDFLASDYTYEIEVKYAIQRAKEDKVRIIPILYRNCDWSSSKLSKFQVVPANGIAITGSSRSSDDGFSQVARALRFVIDDVIKTNNIYTNINTIVTGNIHISGNANVVITSGGNIKIVDINEYQIHDVFRLSGVPKINFVEPSNFKRLVASIKHQGRGIIIEGPSGIGKTTCISRAIEKLHLKESEYTYLSARNPVDIEEIKTLREWHNSIVVIDDFHRLEENQKSIIADYLKYLADVEINNKKLIIIGIPNTGQKLISFGYDLATRIDIYEFGKNPNEKISELIEKGEQALNIKFDKKTEIILASNGSLCIAQRLCNYSAIQADIDKTQQITKIITTNLAEIIEEVKKEFSRQFDDFIFEFAQLGGKKDRTCVKLLKELGISENGGVNLDRLQGVRPNLANGIEKLIEEKLIQNLLGNTGLCKEFLFFDNFTNDLVIDDPNLLFYINNTSEETIANLSGKRTMKEKNKVFISYSHKDIGYFERIMVHLRPLVRDEDIDIWSDKRIKPGEKWSKEIEKALEEAKVAILLLSADFIASEYIIRKELPVLIKSNYEEGTVVIPIFLKPANLNKFENITQYQGINTPNQTLIDLAENEQEKLFVKLSQAVEEIYELKIV